MLAVENEYRKKGLGKKMVELVDMESGVKYMLENQKFDQLNNNMNNNMYQMQYINVKVNQMQNQMNLDIGKNAMNNMMGQGGIMYQQMPINQQMMI